MLYDGNFLSELQQKYCDIKWFTTWNFVAFDFSCHPDDATVVSQSICQLFDTKLLVIQDIVDHEREAVLQEHNLHKTRMELFRHMPSLYLEDDCCYLWQLSLAQIQEMYQRFIMYGRPLITIESSSHDGCHEAIWYVQSWLQQRQWIWSTSPLFFQHAALYKPLIEQFSSDNTGQYILLTSSVSMNEEYMYHKWIFLWRFVYYCVGDMSRFYEWVTYDVASFHKTVWDARENVTRFITKMSSQQLVILTQDFFGKDEQYFENIKYKMVKMAQTRKDVYSQSSYHIGQMYYHSWELHDISVLAEQIESINYQEFREFYKKRLTNLSIQVDPYKEKLQR